MPRMTLRHRFPGPGSLWRVALAALVSIHVFLPMSRAGAQRDTAFTAIVIGFEEEVSAFIRQIASLEARVDQALLDGRTAIANCDEPAVLRAVAALRQVQSDRQQLESRGAALRGRMLETVRDIYGVLTRVSLVEQVDADTNFQSLLRAGRGIDLARVAKDLAESRTLRANAGVAPERRDEVAALVRAIGRQVAAIDLLDRRRNDVRDATLGATIDAAIAALEREWQARKPACAGVPPRVTAVAAGPASGVNSVEIGPGTQSGPVEARVDALARALTLLEAQLAEADARGRHAVDRCDGPGVQAALDAMRRVQRDAIELSRRAAEIRLALRDEIRGALERIYLLSDLGTVDGDTNFRSLSNAGRVEDLARLARDLDDSKTVRLGAAVAPGRRDEVSALARLIGRLSAAVARVDRINNELRQILPARADSAIAALTALWAAREPACRGVRPVTHVDPPALAVPAGGDSAGVAGNVRVAELQQAAAALETAIASAQAAAEAAIAACDEPAFQQAMARLRQAELDAIALRRAADGLRQTLREDIRRMLERLIEISDLQNVDPDTNYRSLSNAGRAQDLARLAQDIVDSKTVRGAGVKPEHTAEVRRLSTDITRAVETVAALDAVRARLSDEVLGERVRGLLARLQAAWAAAASRCRPPDRRVADAMPPGGALEVPWTDSALTPSGNGDVFDATQVMIVEVARAALVQPAARQEQAGAAWLFVTRVAWPAGQQRAPPRPATVRALIVSLGQSSGEAFEVQLVSDSDQPVRLSGESLVVEPLKQNAQRQLRQQFQQVAARATSRLTMKLDAYCAEFAKLPPAAGAVFRVAAPERQARFAPMQRVLAASRRLQQAGRLTPDSSPGDYFHSIRQWAMWTRLERWTPQQYADRFVEHTRKNVVSQGRSWTADLERALRGFVPGRWKDILQVLEEADRQGQ